MRAPRRYRSRDEGRFDAPVDQEQPRPPPHDFDIERALLGTILFANSMVETVRDLIAPHHFMEPLHGKIYGAALALIDRGQLASPISMRTYMEAHGQEAGGAAYLVGLASSSMLMPSPRQAALALRRLWQRRELMRVAQEVTAYALDDDGMGEIEARVQAASSELDSIGQQAEALGGIKPFSKSIAGAVDLAEAAHKHGSGLSGLSTGLARLDQILGGLRRSDLVVLASRPSMGKTSLATNIAFNVAKAWRGEVDDLGRERTADGGKVVIFSLEMAGAQLALRIMGEQSDISSARLSRGELTSVEFDRFLAVSAELEHMPLGIDDTAGLSLAQLHTRARRYKRQHGLDLIVVDYLQLIAGARSGDNRTVFVGEITRGLKMLAKDLDIPVLALSQLSRAVEQRADKRPMLSDLRESGSIEQDADVVMFIYRPDYYANVAGAEVHPVQAVQDMGRSEIIIAKHRHGPTGVAELRFDRRVTKFSDP